MSDFPIKKDVSIENIHELAAEVDVEDFDVNLISLLTNLTETTPWTGHFREKKAFETIPQIGRIPLICKTDECEFASVCPIMRELRMSENEIEMKRKLRGQPCRVDRIESIALFANLTTELNVRPEDTVDILTLTSLIRLYIWKRRIDWQIELDGIMLDNVGGISKTGAVYYNKVSNPLFKELETIQKQINSLVSQLNASRQDKAKLEAQRKERDAGMEKMLDMLQKKNKIIEVK